jgi:hypothetical protein
MDDCGDRDPESESSDRIKDVPGTSRTGKFSVSPRLTFLLIGGAALGLIVLMCLVVALIAGLQNA